MWNIFISMLHRIQKVEIDSSDNEKRWREAQPPNNCGYIWLDNCFSQFRSLFFQLPPTFYTLFVGNQKRRAKKGEQADCVAHDTKGLVVKEYTLKYSVFYATG